MKKLILLILLLPCLALAQRYPPVTAGIPTYANAASLPASATNGAAAVTLDTYTFWLFDFGSMMWLAIGSPGSALSVGAIDGESPVANGAQIVTNALYMQSASGSYPGLVNTGTQTFAGTKTFSSTISGSINGNAATATVLAATPTGCSAAEFASSISANGNLGCLPLAASYITGVVPIVNGGTGATTLAQFSVLLGNGSSPLTDVAPSTASYALISTGASSNPIFAQIDLAAGVRGIVPIANGGIGITSGTSGGLLYFSGASTIASSGSYPVDEIMLGDGTGNPPISLGSYGSSGWVLTSNGSSNTPYWAAAPAPSFSGLTTNGAMYATTSTSISSTAAGSIGQVLYVPGVGSAPVFASFPMSNLAAQSANTVFAGPSSGSAAAPTFRALVAADIPVVSQTHVSTFIYNGGTQTFTTSSGTTASTVYTFVAIGGGGGGAGNASNNGLGTGGGGGGGTGVYLGSGFAAGTTIYITVGGGGAGSSLSAAGGSGAQTCISSATACSGTVYASGGGGSGGAAAVSGASLGGTGGTWAGTYGSSGGDGSNGVSQTAAGSGGTGGMAGFGYGSGGLGGFSTLANANGGHTYGGGGGGSGGASSKPSGGGGANGGAFVEWNQ